MNIKKKLISFIVPIRRLNNKTEILLERNANGIFCIKGKFSQPELEDAILNEIDNGVIGSLYQFVYMNEVAQNFNATALSLDYSQIVEGQTDIKFFFLATLEHIKDNTYTWLDINELNFNLHENLITIQKLLKKQLNLSYFGKGIQDCRLNEPVISFDCGGVLLEWNDERLFSAFAKVFSCTVEQFDKIFMGEMCRYALHTGSKGHYEIFKYIEQKTNPASFLSFIDAYYDNEHLIDNNVHVLKQLRIKYPQLRFILASNTNSITEKRIMDNPIIKSSIDNGFFSWRMKIVKPNKSFYEVINKILKTNKIFFVDDTLKNLEASRISNWSTHYLQLNNNISFNFLDKAISLWLKNYNN